MEEDEKPIIFIPRDGNYIEILGHKIDGYSSFESFLEELKELKDVREKNKELEKENKQLKKYWGNKIAEYHKVIELMADSLSDVAFYMDEASEYCEVKKKECDCYQNKLGCKECLLDYFRKKTKGE